MTFVEILITVLAAVLIGILFYYAFKATGPWGSLWTFLLILIIAGLAAEAWIEPVGPVVWNISWVPTLFVILLFALLLAAATPPYRERPEIEPEAETPERAGAAVALGIFFWIFIIFFFGIAIWGIFAALV